MNVDAKNEMECLRMKMQQFAQEFVPQSYPIVELTKEVRAKVACNPFGQPEKMYRTLKKRLKGRIESVKDNTVAKGRYELSINFAHFKNENLHIQETIQERYVVAIGIDEKIPFSLKEEENQILLKYIKEGAEVPFSLWLLNQAEEHTRTASAK